MDVIKPLKPHLKNVANPYLLNSNPRFPVVKRKKGNHKYSIGVQSKTKQDFYLPVASNRGRNGSRVPIITRNNMDDIRKNT